MLHAVSCVLLLVCHPTEQFIRLRLVFVNRATKIVVCLLFVREKGNELAQNGCVWKGLLFTCYHGNHNVQSIISDGLSVKTTTFNHLGKLNPSIPYHTI